MCDAGRLRNVKALLSDSPLTPRFFDASVKNACRCTRPFKVEFKDTSRAQLALANVRDLQSSIILCQNSAKRLARQGSCRRASPTTRQGWPANSSRIHATRVVSMFHVPLKVSKQPTALAGLQFSSSSSGVGCWSAGPGAGGNASPASANADTAQSVAAQDL